MKSKSNRRRFQPEMCCFGAVDAQERNRWRRWLRHGATIVLTGARITTRMFFSRLNTYQFVIWLSESRHFRDYWVSFSCARSHGRDRQQKIAFATAHRYSALCEATRAAFIQTPSIRSSCGWLAILCFRLCAECESSQRCSKPVYAFTKKERDRKGRLAAVERWIRANRGNLRSYVLAHLLPSAVSAT